MADTNLDADQIRELFENISSAVSRTAEEFDEFGNLLSEEQRREKRRQQVVEEVAKKEEELQKKKLEIIQDSIKGLVAFGSTLVSAPGSFAPMKQALNIVSKSISSFADKFGMLGKVVSAFVESFNEVAQFLVDRFEKAYGNFEELTKTGVVTTFRDLNEISGTLGLTFDDAKQVLSAASKDLSLIGGSAISGRKQFELLAFESEDVRRTFQRIGIGAAEFNEYQISYVAQQERMTRGQIGDIRKLSAGSQDYILQLDALAKLTGLSRKQIQSDLEARMRDTRYRAGISTLPREIKNEIDKMLTALGSFAPDFSDGMKDLIASGGAPTTEAAKRVATTLSQGGLNVLQLVQDIRSGGVKGMEALQKMSSAAGPAADKIGVLAAVVGDSNNLTKAQVELMELQLRAGKMTQKEFDEMVKSGKKTVTTQGDVNDSLANAKQSAYNAAINLDLVATSSDLVAKGISLMAEAMDEVSEKMFKLAGKELPEYFKLRQEERKTIEAEKKEREKLAELIGESQKEEKKLSELKIKLANETDQRQKKLLQQQIDYTEQQIQFLKSDQFDAAKKQQEQKVNEAVKKRQDAIRKREENDRAEGRAIPGSAGIGRPSAQQLTENRITEEDLIKRGFNIKPGATQKEGAGISPKLLKIAEVLNAKFSGDIERFTGFNDGYNRGSGSKHSDGMAFDFTLKEYSEEKFNEIASALKSAGASSVLDEYKNPSRHATGKHIHVEIPEFAKGGIVTGPKTGFPAMLHGKEMIQPLNSDSILEKLATTPSTEIVKQPEPMIDMGPLKEAFNKMDQKLSSVVELLSNGNRYTKNIAQNLV
jgi:hypothetical protein